MRGSFGLDQGFELAAQGSGSNLCKQCLWEIPLITHYSKLEDAASRRNSAAYGDSREPDPKVPPKLPHTPKAQKCMSHCSNSTRSYAKLLIGFKFLEEEEEHVCPVCGAEDKANLQRPVHAHRGLLLAG